ncbi:hypothetical protein CTI12_AA368000 [Artemisia annua]|uniref:Plant heme peroxidase family profile domain-containing protein n=1 Tax=Artemisia annua TaxID=35608 RepID=A0A2U1MKJ2_ARTAN|nr:hypothetical protein CTI12_AA368000 [Artemisia annua]
MPKRYRFPVHGTVPRVRNKVIKRVPFKMVWELFEKSRFGTRIQKRGLKAVNVSGGKLGTAVTTKCFASDPAQLKSAREDIKELLKTTFCHPILMGSFLNEMLANNWTCVRRVAVRLGWHDAGTYNKNIEEWPQRGGANGSLVNALKLLQPIKDKYTGVTYADLFQLASATAVEEAGGPKLPMKYGRVDVSGPEQCPEEGRLPDFTAVFLHFPLVSVMHVFSCAFIIAYELRSQHVRLGWHDAGTYNKNIEEWPQRGGANGSLVNALKLLQPIKDKYTGVTYADLFQLASATAVEEAGGPKLPMKYGRVDVSGPEQCPEEGRLPDAGPPSPADHLRDVFYRMGLSDKDIVALSGAHTLGRSRPERSGWGKPETKYTKEGPGAPGGQSWTVKWLRFDNSYFKDIKEKRDEDLLVLPTDAALFDDPSFKVFAEKYAEDEKAFFTDYAEAHAKLSNLGAKFDPAEGFSIDDEPAAPVGEKFVAAKYSSGKRELSDAMKQKIRSEYVGFGGSPDKPLQSNYFLNIIIVIAVLAILTSLVGN